MSMLTEQTASRVIANLEAMCQCGDRPASQCDEPWGPECDLGNNEKFVARAPDDVSAEINKALGIAPIDMILHCPNCGVQHIDAPEKREVDECPATGQGCQIGAFGPKGEMQCQHCGSEPHWTNPPHRTHLCHGCGYKWRPADVPTNGVAEIQTKGKDDSPRPLVAVDRVPRGMGADDAKKLISECAEQAGVDTGDFKPLGWNVLHRVVQAAHKAGFMQCLTRVGLGDKS